MMKVSRKLADRRGLTLVEVIVAAGLLSFALIGMLALFANMLNLWCKGSSGTSANSYAAIGARRLVLNIQEGMTATTNTDGTRLTITFPYRPSPTSDYVRGTPGVVATYYLSGPTGSETSGELAYLWKQVGTSKTRLAKKIMRIDNDPQKPPFTVTHGKLVILKLKGQDREGGAISPNIIQQSVKLRNS